nr:S49 family peptidase [Solirubrobacteraceae bacterium]
MATRRGVIAFVVLLTVLGALVLAAALRFREPSSSVPGRSVLVYRVPFELHESDPPYRAMSFDALRWRERPVVWDVVDGLRQAAEDDGVKALVLHIEDLGWGWGRLAEVREAILRFRASGKPVYASLEGGGDAEYYLASAADLVSAPPSATLAIDGLSASATFLRGSLDKLGVRPNYLHVGEYKSGVETYTRGGMSAESRESLELMLDTQFRLMLAGIGGTRPIGSDSLRRLVDQGPFLAREA